MMKTKSEKECHTGKRLPRPGKPVPLKMGPLAFFWTCDCEIDKYTRAIFLTTYDKCLGLFISVTMK
jgi:hypothetical protein